ncbi:hypothetical protein [Pseudaestuariivita rosea]|uniref:hypothetical protein n=1 Tax=Pseudaestuariivita rosea TaxID=2763263 RepID=UPI001ABB1F30|nr:hypothetical protein [Pseudaestuariivita rosea]
MDDDPLPIVTIDAVRVRSTLDLLQNTSPEERLPQLEAICIAQGLWGVPSTSLNARPVLYEIDLFGVAAAAHEIEDLPRHWMQAAQNILQDLREEDTG